MKSFMTIEEQIEILRNRGLIINDEERAKDYLLSNNYYNIINGYGKFFPRNGECYTNNTTFDEITRLYLLDKEIKQALFRAIINIEAHIKAIFAYRFAERFPDTRYAYLNIECYDKNKTLYVVSTIAKLSNIIKLQQSYKGSSVNHYVNNHNDVPIWVLVNYLDFGGLLRMIESVGTDLQNKVAKDMLGFINQNINVSGVFTPETMISFVANLIDVRNICAHNNRLLDYRCKRDSKYWNPIHSIYSIKPADERRSVYSTFISTQCFLSKIEYAYLHNSIRKLMHSHLNKIQSLDSDKILFMLGFPNDWHNKTSKINQEL